MTFMLFELPIHKITVVKLTNQT